MAGFSQGGGVGLVLANWMTEGDPGHDVFGMDVARFGEWASLRYTNAKVRENYARRFSIRFPNEELAAARPQQTTPLYDIQVGENRAVMGVTWGMEVPLWYAPEGEPAEDVLSFHRSNDFAAVGEEVRAVRERGRRHRDRQLRQVRGDAGRAAEAWLEGLLANAMPRTGRIALAPMLNEAGKLIGDFTVAKRGTGGLPGLGVVGGAAPSPALVRGASAGAHGGAGRAAGDAADGADARRPAVAGGAGGAGRP